MSEERRTIEEIARGEAWPLYLASLAGDMELALQLERLGLSDEEDSLVDARRLRPVLFASVEAAVEEVRGGDDG
jgi:hypothetical protein